ncbi:imidazole glycerol phosphate synthase subunit HisH [Sediminibacterium ginsengisoli]|uniref:Imidazole glycerol phosphate synthase subunit HisH n=1 Tax=Sediminibacterium ginsengisoli TaxID=413434 RepID=A0A1T4N4M6_9BACT|nr:imidazole glycerol phosphate synthase subunit HisH [Sediminibacterium ginsengisoli]SJZ74203.1 glutamine amidotransferase [Sediminibacterium ginsengisoli]
MVTIINYGSGNVRAIANIYERLRIEHSIASRPEDFKDTTKIILPGVGAFDETMSMLNNSGFVDILTESVILKKTPVLGICVGMQILAESSEEGELKGLGWIGGQVKKIDKNNITNKPKIPHLGWNSVKIKNDSQILQGINEEEGFYFVHSYYFECTDEKNCMTESFYGEHFTSSVKKDNIIGVQFHPEKSHQNGITLLKNFAEFQYA